MHPSATVSVFRATLANMAGAAADRAATNRANAQHSTGPRTQSGKRRSSLNALRHGLTARSAVLPTEDPVEYQQHCRGFQDEYQPATPTEAQLVKLLADTSWRLNRIPLLEADVLSRAMNPPSEEAAIRFDIVDAHRLVGNLSLHSARLSRQFQKALDQVRNIQSERRDRERRDLRQAAALSELHKHKGIPWQPSDHGFVFSKEEVERHAERLIRQNEAYHFDYVRFDMPTRLVTGR